MGIFQYESLSAGFTPEQGENVTMFKSRWESLFYCLQSHLAFIVIVHVEIKSF